MSNLVTIFSPHNELLVKISPISNDDLPYGDLFIGGNDVKPKIANSYVKEGIKCLLFRAEVKGLLEDFFIAMVGLPEVDHCNFDIVMSKGLSTFTGIKASLN